jgi:Bacteriophage baseplate protein W
MSRDPGTLFGSGIGFPPRVGSDGRVAWSMGEANVRESIRIILLTEPGERLMRPGFGGQLRSFLFQPNTVATRRLVKEQIERALKQWEPRITLQSVTVEADEDDAQSAVATIHYRLVATQSADQIRLLVPLAG